MLDFIVNSLKQGGLTLLPIFLASFLAWVMVVRTVFRLWGLSLWRGTCRNLIRNPGQIEAWIARRTPQALQRSAAGLVLLRLNNAPFRADQNALENQLDEALKWKVPELDREISLIGTIAAMAPLLGLLGTVSGMIHTFDVISAFGTSNPSLMADSISEALVTTQDGLAVALPLMILHTALLNYRNRIEHLALELGNAYIQFKQQSTARAA